MKLRKPEYYDRFRCIAGACRDSCCIGWEIDVDEEKREMYRNVTGELGERLRTDIDWEDGHFILRGKEERCPFLNRENLCDLIIGLGEESLCEICREHPRFYEWYENLTEVGIGLCCEEAARLVLECEAPARFIVCEDDDWKNRTGEVENGIGAFTAEDDSTEILWKARETAYGILQNRESSVWGRLARFLTYIEEVQEGLDFENLDEIEESAEYYGLAEWEHEPEEQKSAVNREWLLEVVQICRELEAIDETWPKTLDALETLLGREDFEELEDAMCRAYEEREYEYEHLAVYFVYRYFMKCRIDGDLYSKGMLTVFCLHLIHLLDVLTFANTGHLTKEERAWNAKNCSKEIEYSEENLEALAEVFWDRDLLYKS